MEEEWYAGSLESDRPRTIEYFGLLNSLPSIWCSYFVAFKNWSKCTWMGQTVVVELRWEEDVNNDRNEIHFSSMWIVD